MKTTDAPPRQNNGRRDAIATDRREFVRLAGTVAAAVMWPLGGEARAATSEAESDEKSEGPPATFAAGGHAVEARKIQAGPLEAQYFECGSPDGVPLVLVHGFPDAPVAWQDVVKELDLARYRIVLPYLRGYGGSVVAEPDYLGGQTAALAHDLLALTSSLKMERFHVVGHDWGARAAYAAAVLAPERLLTLTGLASPYLAYRGEPPPPAQVHGQWYQYFFQVDAAKKMLAEHRQDFCRELWRTWCPQWQFTEAEFAQAAAAWDNRQFADIVIDYYRMRHGGALSRRAYAQSQARLDARPRAQDHRAHALYPRGGGRLRPAHRLGGTGSGLCRRLRAVAGARRRPLSAPGKPARCCRGADQATQSGLSRAGANGT